MILKVLCLMAISISCGRAKPTETEEYPPKELLEMIRPLHDLCMEQNDVTEEEMNNYVITNNSTKMMCYMHCVFLAAEWVREDGTIPYDLIAEIVHPKFEPYIMPSVNKCHDISPGNHRCAIPYNFHVCLYNQDPEHWFLV